MDFAGFCECLINKGVYGYELTSSMDLHKTRIDVPAVQLDDIPLILRANYENRSTIDKTTFEVSGEIPKAEYCESVTIQGVTPLHTVSHLTWEREPSGTPAKGIYPKAREVENSVKYYYKVSKFQEGQGIIGHEALCEVTVSRLLRLLKIEDFPFVEYELLYGEVNLSGRNYKTFLTKSGDFRGRKIRESFEDYYRRDSLRDETPPAFSRRIGIADFIYKIFLIDFPVYNIDRHGSNIEVLLDNEKYEVAPVFDSGVCLSAPAIDETKITKDFELNIPANNFIGSNDLQKNLGYIQGKIKYNHDLKADDPDCLFTGMRGALKYETFLWIKNLIWRRYCYVRTLHFS